MAGTGSKLSTSVPIKWQDDLLHGRKSPSLAVDKWGERLGRRRRGGRLGNGGGDGKSGIPQKECLHEIKRCEEVYHTIKSATQLSRNPRPKRATHPQPCGVVTPKKQSPSFFGTTWSGVIGVRTTPALTSDPERHSESSAVARAGNFILFEFGGDGQPRLGLCCC